MMNFMVHAKIGDITKMHIRSIVFGNIASTRK